jgi:Na+-translocating ferredoxin:NAD+ oxidoreductase RnfD subunit
MTTSNTTLPWQDPAVRRFFRTPKGLFLAILILVALIAIPFEGGDRVLPGIIAATGTAALLDLGIVLVTREVWIFPDGAILTGMLMGFVLSPEEPLYVPILTAILAIASKHLLRTRWSNVFNPAAFALVLAAILFSAGESWWGSLPDVTPLAIVVLGSAGLFITNRLNKLPMVLVFLGAYFGAFTITSFVADPAQVAEIFRSPDANAALFFAFFMLDDPPTSPIKYGDQIRYSLIVAAVSYLTFITLGGVYYLLAGVLVGNAWESWRRVSARWSAVTAGRA